MLRLFFSLIAPLRLCGKHSYKTRTCELATQRTLRLRRELKLRQHSSEDVSLQDESL